MTCEEVSEIVRIMAVNNRVKTLKPSSVRAVAASIAMATVLFASSSVCAAEPVAASEPEAMTFTYKHDHFANLGMDFQLIKATGLFVEGTATGFRRFVEQNKILEQRHEGRAVVILESDGGTVPEALSMGRMIRQMGFGTEVDTHCFSACTLAFLGAVRRKVGVKAESGVHRISTDARLDPAQALALGQIWIAEEIEYSAFMGADPSFVTAINRSWS